MRNLIIEILFKYPTNMYKFQGDAREGGYYFLTSKALPGFSLLLESSEVNDVGKLSRAMSESINAYLKAYFKYLGKDPANLVVNISYADLRGAYNKKRIYFAVAYTYSG
jgi:hypothetical protein